LNLPIDIDKKEEAHLMTAEPPTIPELPYAFVLIYREDLDHDSTAAIVADDGPVLQGETVGRYHAEFAFSERPFTQGDDPETEPAFPGVEVYGDVDPDPDLNADADDALIDFALELEAERGLANEEAAHKEIWKQVREHLREVGYTEFAYSDRGVLNDEQKSGQVDLDAR
jgi:hypothetical protein